MNGRECGGGGQTEKGKGRVHENASAGSRKGAGILIGENCTKYVLITKKLTVF